MIKKNDFTALIKASFSMPDDGGPAGGYTFYVSVIKNHNSIFLESFLKWEVRDSEVERFLFRGDTNKLIEWVKELNEFDTESAQYFFGLINKMKSDHYEVWLETFALSFEDLPKLEFEI